NLVNAFKTDAAGLPLLDTYNDEGLEVTSDEGLHSSDTFTPYTGTLDPRLDWTVGRRGLPYHDWGNHPGDAWIRDQAYGGPYLPKKNVMDKAHEQEYYDRTAGWASFNANNLKLLRYADLLLYAAEAEVELGNLEVAQELVNRVRLRATDPATWVHKYIDPENPSIGFTNIPAANYLIKLYTSGHFTSMGKDYARKAVRFERRLELAMEGHRFFDLVRWGMAAEEKNKYFQTEKIKRTYMAEAYFKEGKNEYLPIPQTAIDLSFKDGIGTLEQHKGYQ
ncbi:MAG TPA: RagB/SusD family nutrient uptake outer membrane protein, partial [Chryseolinea sp.]|nr:RagB/SusD family nutrient uptake outer membrane protein [Chryseolinea sp.]